MKTLTRTEEMEEQTPIGIFIEFEKRAEELGATEHVAETVVLARDIFSGRDSMHEFDKFVLRSLKTSHSPLFTGPEVLATTMNQDLKTRVSELFPGLLELLDELDQNQHTI